MTYFLWQPNETQTITETYEFLTDVQTSYNGFEERIALREYPRVSLSYTVTANKEEAQKIINFVRRNQGKVVKVPSWLNGFPRLTSGATQNVYDETGLRPVNLGFLNGSNNAIFYKNASKYDVRAVVGSGPENISLSSPSINDFPLGSMIYPFRDAYINNAIQVTYLTDNLVNIQVHVTFLEPTHFTTSLSLSEYKTKDVFVRTPNRIQDNTANAARLLMELDYLTGKRSIHDQSNRPFLSLKHYHSFLSRVDKHNFLEWYHNIRGRHKDFYIPSWECDFSFIRMEPSITPNSIITVNNDAHKDLLSIPKDLIFLGKDFYTSDAYINPARMKEINSIDWIVGTQEQQINPTDTISLNALVQYASKISYLYNVRLDSDTISFSHHSKEFCTTDLIFYTI